VGVIDVKEPAHGALGRPTPDVVRAVADCVGDRRPVSLALGELLDLETTLYEEVLARPQVHFAKIGLAGTGALPHWWRAWEAAWSRLPGSVGRVGVIYADWRQARMPHPADAIEVFAGTGCRAILFDTFTKDGRSLLDVVAAERLGEWVTAARAASTIVLAGSLSVDSLGGLCRYRPDLVGIRGAACSGGRLGRLSNRRLADFASALQQAFNPAGVATCCEHVE
jgi:uncharacterized protein (UPF0264 family)